jgi:hypothetical protein
MDLTRSYHTNRIYLRAQAAFIFWCKAQRLRHPVSAHDLARYLRHAMETRGTTVVPVHLSAIAAMYRPKGWEIDVKTEVLQRELRQSRTGVAA